MNFCQFPSFSVSICDVMARVMMAICVTGWHDDDEVVLAMAATMMLLMIMMMIIIMSI